MKQEMIYMDKLIPGVKHVKTDREKKIDSCIPEAAEFANIRLMEYVRQSEQAISSGEMGRQLSRLFLEEMSRITNERGFRRSGKLNPAHLL